ncbi:putative FBD-associated F-box protein At5g50270 isoform X1 [Pyrus x bretschneideri]|uniref:putative FBD-associated F-box protein At5g50270 isoform X1 n=1 Tax=Pyrus x bretschneideri TaxID=225117 RepID=UPI0020307966|nr:putative FBD-associated F-box protein At5g50270 isoform X1 [Pyrus x bretschneideri]
MSDYASLFATFVINVLRLINLPCLRKLAFFCSDHKNLNCINSWLLRACTSNTVEVEIRISYTENPIELPQILSVSTSLLVLKLNGNIRLDFPPDCVCFPSLKVLWIRFYSEDGISFTEKLLHICRVLEDLFIEGDILNKKRELVLKVKSNTLKWLKIECLVHNFNADIDYSFAVDCPNLKNLELCDDFLAKYRITVGLKVLDYAKICVGDPSADYGKLELYFEVNHSNRAFELLEALSNVKSLSLSGGTTGAVGYSYETRDNVEEIALQIRLRNFAVRFPFLACLELVFCTCESWNLLALLLHSSPKLQYLILRIDWRLKRDFAFRRLLYKMPEGSTPECLGLCLQEIEILGFEGALYELTVVEFLLAHAEVLQKMRIHVQEVTPDAEMRFRNQVLEYPRASEACQVEMISTTKTEN